MNNSMNYKIIYMKQKTENNKHNKGGPGVKSNFVPSTYGYLNCLDRGQWNKKGFVAWPEVKRRAVARIDDEITEGRTRNGGYVAYPKSTALGEKVNLYYPKKAS